MIHKKGVEIMPKIIKDIDKTIRSCALNLFVELPYTNVDMKMIAKNSGIAVGTLYNYYESKKQLYISILKESWQNTFNKLDDICRLDLYSEEKLVKFISTLYEDIETRNGLGKVLINTSIDELKNNNEINDLKDTLILKLELFFNSYSKGAADNKLVCNGTRLVGTILASMFIMLEYYPDSKEDNLSFLTSLIELTLK